jgi:hypothetical protein
MTAATASWLPLEDALFAFGDPGRVAAYKATKIVSDRAKREFTGSAIEFWEKTHAFEMARWDLFKDLTTQFGQGKLEFTGVQDGPVREIFARKIPAARADEFRIDHELDFIYCLDYRFINVFVRKKAQPRRVSEPTHECAPFGEHQKIMVATKKGGKLSYDPLIREAAEAKWEMLTRRVFGDAESKLSISAVATILYDYLVAKYGGDGSNVHLPVPETIRTRLRRIYDEMLAEEPVR